MRISDWSLDVCSSELLNSRALRVSLLLEPFEGLKNTTIIDYYRNHSTGGGSVLTNVLPGPNALSATGTLTGALEQLELQRARGPRVIDSDVDAFERVLRFGVTNRTEIEMGENRSEEHTSELQSLMRISYAVFCLKK